jgi:catechol-2,3-dioxygenase
LSNEKSLFIFRRDLRLEDNTGLHHRLALNTWLSRAGTSHKDGESGLEQLTIHFTDKASYKRLLPRIPKSSLQTAINKVMVTDPDGIKMALVCDDQ